MSGELLTNLGIIGAVLAVMLCCAGPLLVAAITAAGLTAWLSYSGYVLIAAALILIPVGGGVLPLRRPRASEPLPARSSRQGVKT